MRPPKIPVALRRGAPPVFPDPREADDEGLLAIGGDLSEERLLAAYEHGIFPWYDRGVPPLWWSPNPRAVLDPGRLHVSRSLGRKIRREEVALTWNTAFERVMRECASQRDGGTWILSEMISAYSLLHAHGHAHSVEVWVDGDLAGGLYGVQRGALFAAESMFHRRTDASKIALVASVRSLFRAGIEVYDVQLLTEHLASMGAHEIPRREYLARVAAACRKPVDVRSLALTLAPAVTEPIS